MSRLNERSRRQIALLAGEDLEGVPAEEARRSVESCPNCRGHWARVRGCLDLMERVAKEGAEAGDGASVWPALEARLSRPVVRGSDRFNGWVPALSMAAACIALMIAGQMEAPLSEDPADIAFPVGRTITSPMLSLAGNPHVRPEPAAPPLLDGVTPDPAPEQDGGMRGLMPRYAAPLRMSPLRGDSR